MSNKKYLKKIFKNIVVCNAWYYIITIFALQNLIMDIENTASQMRKGLLELCILGIIHKGKEAYTTDILEQLKEANLVVLEGTLYPLLTRLKNATILSYRWEESPSGPPRKYYALTQKGETTYKQLKKAWNELSQSIDQVTN